MLEQAESALFHLGLQLHGPDWLQEALPATKNIRGHLYRVPSYKVEVFYLDGVSNELLDDLFLPIHPEKSWTLENFDEVLDSELQIRRMNRSAASIVPFEAKLVAKASRARLETVALFRSSHSPPIAAHQQQHLFLGQPRIR